MEQHSELEGAQMGALLLAAQQVLGEAEQLAAGQLVRIASYQDGRPVWARVYPARVARFAFRALGSPAPVYAGCRLTFTSQGTTVTVEPTREGFSAFCLAVLAHLNGQIRRRDRIIKRNTLVLRALDERLRQRGQEGGPQA